MVAVDVTVRLPLAAPVALGEKETVKVALCPPARVRGVVIPLTLIPGPVTPTWVTDTLEAPVLVIVSESVVLLPTFTFPKLRLVGFALKAPGVTPVPDTGIDSEGLLASEEIVTVPLALPLDFGTKAIVNVVLCEAPSETGVVIPLIEKALLLTDTRDTETLEDCPFVIVTTCDLEAPTKTLPNASVAGSTASAPFPVPLSETVWAPFAASLLIDKLPLNDVAALGVKETLRVTLCPAAIEVGSDGEVKAKYLVDTDAPLMLTVAFPEFVAVRVRVLLVFGFTSPKSRLELPNTRFELC